MSIEQDQRAAIASHLVFEGQLCRQQDLAAAANDEVEQSGLEVDPIIGSDNYTIDLNLAYRCRFGPAENQRFQFFGMLTICDGNHVLVGTAPTPDGDTIVVFASAAVQYPGNWYTRTQRSESSLNESIPRNHQSSFGRQSRRN